MISDHSDEQYASWRGLFLIVRLSTLVHLARLHRHQPLGESTFASLPPGPPSTVPMTLRLQPPSADPGPTTLPHRQPNAMCPHRLPSITKPHAMPPTPHPGRPPHIQSCSSHPQDHHQRRAKPRPHRQQKPRASECVWPSERGIASTTLFVRWNESTCRGTRREWERPAAGVLVEL